MLHYRYILSAGENIISKIILTDFPYPLTASVCHSSFIALLLGPILRVWRVSFVSCCLQPLLQIVGLQLKDVFCIICCRSRLIPVTERDIIFMLSCLWRLEKWWHRLHHNLAYQKYRYHTLIQVSNPLQHGFTICNMHNNNVHAPRLDQSPGGNGRRSFIWCWRLSSSCPTCLIMLLMISKFTYCMNAILCDKS